ncbi:MAG: transporter substrate-binding domain-containing protein [Oscillospiraceae bacterium]|nr:transporter substrate-binding domain-containing protein [Oscillospiraceae bacterium]MDY3792049.1 transporter substrate-binding domain-containing protein [Oscillospiraceae bacterium]MDY6208085.1 transporter substrate-binding domain-containing protein [Oscillospiraceae bacterium]
MKRKSVFKRIAAAAMAAAMAIGFAGCSSSSGTSSASSDGPLTLDKIKANGKLTVATEAAYEPFEYLDGEKIVGYNADLFAKICEDMGVELDYIDLPFQGILAGLEAKKYDVVGATLGITAERASKYTMTYPIQNGTTVFVKRKNDDSIQSIADMEGKKVGTQTSCYNEADTKKYNEQLIANGGSGYAELLTYDSFPEAFLELKNGRIDLVAQNYASCAAVVKNNPDDYVIVADANGNAEYVGTDTWVGWAVRPEDTELSEFINSEIHKFKEDGTLAELQTKWFGATTELPEENYIPAE